MNILVSVIIHIASVDIHPRSSVLNDLGDIKGVLDYYSGGSSRGVFDYNGSSEGLSDYNGRM